MTPELRKKIRSKCDQLALEFFERSADLRTVSFQVQQIVEQQLLYRETQDKRDKRERERGAIA
jgi:hypothetical protein